MKEKEVWAVDVGCRWEGCPVPLLRNGNQVLMSTWVFFVSTTLFFHISISFSICKTNAWAFIFFVEEVTCQM